MSLVLLVMVLMLFCKVCFIENIAKCFAVTAHH